MSRPENKKISEFEALSALADAGLLVVVSNGKTYKITKENLLKEVNQKADTHINDKNNPHQTTAEQVGADASGTAVEMISDHESIYNHNNYNTAYSWGPHAGLYDLIGTAGEAIDGHEEEFNHELINTAIQQSEKNANNGVAGLDQGGKILVDALPSSVMEFKGVYNPVTNSPALVNGVGNAGDVYLCSVAGTHNFGAGDITFAVGDWVVYNGTIWEKSINSNAVVSVNGQQGVVVLNADHISDESTIHKFVTATMIANWDTAYEWGDHSIQGYLKTEQDPAFLASPASGITQQDIDNWNNELGKQYVFDREINVNRDNFILYGDITPMEVDTDQVLKLDPDGSNFVCKFPIPISVTVGKQNVQFWKRGQSEPISITEYPKTYKAGINRDPLSLDWVFAFKVNKPYDANADYYITWREIEIPIVPNGIPFRNDGGKKFFMDQLADDILLPPLPDNYVYEVWRWCKNSGGTKKLKGKRASFCGIMKEWREGYGRYKLYFRGDQGEHTLSAIMSRSENGLTAIMGGQNDRRRKITPFLFYIYNTVTAARSRASLSYGWAQTGNESNIRGFRRIKIK